MRERGVGRLALGRGHGLEAHIGIQAERRIGQQRGDAIEAANRQRRTFEQGLALAAEIERRGGRQGSGHEGADDFACGLGLPNLAGPVAIQAAILE